MLKHVNHFKFIFLVCLLGTHCNSYGQKRPDIMQTLYAIDFTKQRNHDAKPGFTMEGEMGVSIATGNTSASSLNARLDANHEMKTWSNRYSLQGLYTRSKPANSEQDAVATAQRSYALLHADYKLSNPNKRIFIFADYEEDRFNAFDYQSAVATGWSELRWKDETSSFRYSIGPGYNFSKREDSEATDDSDGLIVRASAEYQYNWSSGARLRQFFSTAAGEENTRSRSETSLSANIMGELAMKLSIRLDHNTSPNSEDARLNTETSVALVYQFF